jgi:hypothetical protein
LIDRRPDLRRQASLHECRVGRRHLTANAPRIAPRRQDSRILASIAVAPKVEGSLRRASSPCEVAGAGPHGKDPRYWIDVGKIIYVPDGKLAPANTVQIALTVYCPGPSIPDAMSSLRNFESADRPWPATHSSAGRL